MNFPSTLFVLGDSISIGYDSFLERLLAGRFGNDHVHYTPAVSQLQAAYITGWLEAFPYA